MRWLEGTLCVHRHSSANFLLFRPMGEYRAYPILSPRWVLTKEPVEVRHARKIERGIRLMDSSRLFVGRGNRRPEAS